MNVNPLIGMLKGLGGFAVLSVKGILTHASRDMDCLDIVGRAVFLNENADAAWPPPDKAVWTARASAAILGLRDYFAKITSGGTP